VHNIGLPYNEYISLDAGRREGGVEGVSYLGLRVVWGPAIVQKYV